MIRAALAALAFASSTASMAATLYAVNDGSNSLYTVDQTTLAVTLVGALGAGGNFGDLASDGSTLWYIGGRGDNNLYTLNTATGAATLVGAHGINDLFGLAFDSSTGTLYGTQFVGGSGFYRLNASTGAATLIATLSIGLGGLTYDSVGNRLIGSADGPGDFYSVDRTTGALSLLGGAGFLNDNDSAFDAASGTYVTVDWSSRIFRYDGSFQRIQSGGLPGPFDGIAFVGGTTNPVPEPASWAMLIAGFGLTGAAMRRRRLARA